MKTFDEIRQDRVDPDLLEEGVLRKGAGLVYARQSKVHGDAASRHFSNATNHLTRPADALDDQITNIRNAMKELSSGLTRMRDQNGSITSLCLVGVLLSEKGKR
jgi:hypothetical protein